MRLEAIVNDGRKRKATSIMVEELAMRLEAIADFRTLKPGRTADPLRPELPDSKVTSEYEPATRYELDR